MTLRVALLILKKDFAIVNLSSLDACFEAAEPGGWMITSLTEPLIDLRTRWTQVAPALFRRGPG